MISLAKIFRATVCALACTLAASTVHAQRLMTDLTLGGLLNEVKSGAVLTVNGSLVIVGTITLPDGAIAWGDVSKTGADAAADGTTKGIATFAAADFNAASGVISIDYTNGQAATGSLKGFLTAADWTTFNAKAPTASPTFTTQITTPKVVFTGAVQDLHGTGDPEGVITAAVGSTFRRTDGGTTTTLYVKESGSGNTGWVAAGAGGGGSGSITASGYTQTTARLLGRTTASTGAIEEITVGSGLSMSAGTLSATGGSGGTKTLARFTAADNQPPSATYATFDTRNSILVLDFDAGTAESAVFSGIIPEAADFTTGIKVRLIYTATSATSGDTIWTIAFERGTTDLDSDSFATGLDTAASTTSGTSGIATVITKDFSGSEIDGLTAGDFFRVKVTRKAADGGDTMTGDAELLAVEIQQR